MRRPRIRGRAPVAGAVAAALAVAGVVAAGSEGFSAAKVMLASGQAWVASSGVGQIALIDGSTEDKVAAVAAGAPGRAISVVQAGPDALVVDSGAGTVRRVRGSTYDDAPGPVTPLPGGSDLRVYAGAGRSVYAVDGRQGSAVVLDRETMAPRGRPLSLAADLGTGSTLLDDEGRLWAVDGSDGDVIRIDATGKRTAEKVASGSAPLVLVRGEPAVVDARGRRALLLDPDSGEVAAEACLDTDPGKPIEVGGSPSRSVVHVVAPSRGVLLTSSFDDGSCSSVVPVGEPGARLGPPVEAGGRVFVPDYGTGTVTVVDPATESVVGRAQVLDGGVESFELLPRDGYVFYNHPASERAGVIRLDGTVRPVQKYDRKRPTNDLRRPVRGSMTGADDNGGEQRGDAGGSRDEGDDAGSAPATGESDPDRGGKGTPDRPSAGPARPAAPGIDSGTPQPGPSDRDPARPDQDPPAGPQDPPAGPQRPDPGGGDAPVDRDPPIVDGDGPVQPDPEGNGTGISRIAVRTEGDWLTGTQITFVASVASGEGGISSAVWQFDDATRTEGERTAHAFATPGEHFVTVTAAIDGVPQAPVRYRLTISDPGQPPNAKPVLEAAFDDAEGEAPFAATLRVRARDTDDPELSYKINWGDGSAEWSGSSGSGEVAQPHTYPAGTWTALVTVADGRGEGAGQQVTIQVSEPPQNVQPVAAVTLAAAGGRTQAPLELVADAGSSRDPDGTVAAYRFVWSDGTDSGWQAAPTQRRAFGTAGTHTVTVTVRDGAGLDSAAATSNAVTVEAPEPVNSRPTAALDVSTAGGAVNLAVTADAGRSSDPDAGDALSYEISWGDGTVSTSATASHTYRRTGTFTVRLTVSDGRASDTATRTVDVNAPATAASGSVNLGSGEPVFMDMDTGTSGFMTGTIDLDFFVETNRLMVFVDGGGPGDGLLGVGSAATYNACLDASMSSHGSDAPYLFDPVADVGSVLCYETDSGRPGVLTLQSGGVFSFRTWEKP